MSTSRRLLLVAAATASLWGFQAQAWGLSERVKGSGEIASETRAVEGFDGITVAGHYEVIVKQGPATKVEVRADKNLLPYIETTVYDGSKGRNLEVKPKRGFELSTSSTPVITIELPTLRAVALAGSGKIKVEGMKLAHLNTSLAGTGDILVNGLDADQLSLQISGSGNIVASGRAQSSSITIAGSGDAKTSGLAANEVKVSIAGSGNAVVQANQRLKVSIAGSGDVAYSGSPEVSSSIAGSGSVKRLTQ